MPTTSPDPAAGAPATNRAQLLRMVGGVVDQGVWALSNISLVIVTAKRSGLKDVGVMGVLVLVYVLILGAIRAVTGLSLIIRFTAVEDDTRTRGTAAAAKASALLGLSGTVTLVAIGLIGGGRMQGPMLAVAMQFPLLMVQDVMRYTYLAERRPWRAAVTDLVWLVVSVAAYPIAIVNGFGTAGMAFAWGAGGCVSGLIELAILRLPLTARGTLRFLRDNWDIGRHQVAEAVLQYGSSVFAVTLLGFVASLDAVGQVNMGVSLLGPLRALLLGVALAAVPDAVHTLKSGTNQLRRHIVVVAAGLAGLAAFCGLVVQVVPAGIGRLFLGNNWHPAQQIAVPLAIGFVGLAVSFGPLVGLRSFERAGVIVRCSVVQVVLSTIAFVVGAVAGGAMGAAYGQAVGLIASTFVWWHAWLTATPAPSLAGRDVDTEGIVADRLVIEELGTLAAE